MVFGHSGFEVDRVGAMLSCGHGMVPPTGHRVALHNLPHTMAASAVQEFAHKPVHYPGIRGPCVEKTLLRRGQVQSNVLI